MVGEALHGYIAPFCQKSRSTRSTVNYSVLFFVSYWFTTKGVIAVKVKYC